MAIKKTIKNEKHQVIHPITEVEAVEGLSEALVQKQDLLDSGVNIRTINGQSLLGPGDIVVGESGQTIIVDNELSLASKNPVQNKVITEALNKAEVIKYIEQTLTEEQQAQARANISVPSIDDMMAVCYLGPVLESV